MLALAALSTASTSSIPLHACKPPRDLSAASTVPSAASVRLFLRGGSSSADAVWAAAVDAGSGRTYYYNVKTKEVAWALPPGATLRPPRTAGAGAGASAGTTAGGGGGSGATASAAGAVESGTAAQPASGGGQAQQAPLTHATAGSANDKGTQTGDDSLVTVHAPPVVAEVDPGFGRKPAEPAPAPDNTAAFNGQPLAAGAGNQGPAAGPGTAVPGGEVAAASPQPQAAVAQQTSSAATDAATAGAASTRPQLSSNSLWKEVLDPASGRVYYFHTITKESVWELPNLTEVEEETSFTKFFTRLKTTAGRDDERFFFFGHARASAPPRLLADCWHASLSCGVSVSVPVLTLDIFTPNHDSNNTPPHNTSPSLTSRTLRGCRSCH